MTPKKLPTEATCRVRDLPEPPEGQAWCARRWDGWRCNCGARPPLITSPEAPGAAHQHIPVVGLSAFVGDAGGLVYVPVAASGLRPADPIWVPMPERAAITGEERP